MSKFKVGDRVVIKPEGGSRTFSYDLTPGKVFTITNDDGSEYCQYTLDGRTDGAMDIASEKHLELVTTKEIKPMARRTFKLLKDTPDSKVGALFQEQCEDGTQPYELINADTHFKGELVDEFMYSTRSLVEDQPKWFVEVFKVQPEYMTQAELDQFEAFKKANKPAAKKSGRPAKKASK